MANPKMGDPFSDGLQFLGPRRYVKEGSTIREERLRPSRQDEEYEMDELMQGLSSHDLRGPPSGFMRHMAGQNKSAYTPSGYSNPSPADSYGETPGSDAGGYDENPTGTFVDEKKYHPRGTSDTRDDLQDYEEPWLPGQEQPEDLRESQVGPSYASSQSDSRDILAEISKLFEGD